MQKINTKDLEVYQFHLLDESIGAIGSQKHQKHQD